MRLPMQQQIAEGDWVATRWTASGTNRGKLFDAPPTNRPVTVEGIVFSRIADGQIAEEFECYDALGMMRQLGAVKAWGIAA